MAADDGYGGRLRPVWRLRGYDAGTAATDCRTLSRLYYAEPGYNFNTPMAGLSGRSVEPAGSGAGGAGHPATSLGVGQALPMGYDGTTCQRLSRVYFDTARRVVSLLTTAPSIGRPGTRIIQSAIPVYDATRLAHRAGFAGYAVPDYVRRPLLCRAGLLLPLFERRHLSDDRTRRWSAGSPPCCTVPASASGSAADGLRRCTCADRLSRRLPRPNAPGTATMTATSIRFEPQTTLIQAVDRRRRLRRSERRNRPALDLRVRAFACSSCRCSAADSRGEGHERRFGSLWSALGR